MSTIAYRHTMSPTSQGSDRTPRAAEAWEILLRVHAALTPALSDEVETKAGLPLSWYDVLLELSRAEGNQLRMQDLGQRVVLSRSRVSRIVDEIEAAGLVERKPDSDDGRVTLTRMTRRGRTAFRQAAPVYLDAISAYFGQHMTVSELKAMTHGLSKVLGGLERG